MSVLINHALADRICTGWANFYARWIEDVNAVLVQKRVVVDAIALDQIDRNLFSEAVYGTADGVDDLVESIQRNGILVPLVVCRAGVRWDLISGHRRLTVARQLG